MPRFSLRRCAARGRDPIIETSLFGDRGFPAALATSIPYFAVATGIVFTAVLYVQEGLGRDVLTSSLAVLPFAARSLVAARRTAPCPSTRAKVMLIGVAVLCYGLAAAVVAAGSSAQSDSSAWMPVPLEVAGLGGGLFTVPFFTAALARVKPHEMGSAAGLLNAVQLGGTLGVAVLGTLFLSRPTPESS